DINADGAVYPGSIEGRFGNRKPPSSAYATLPPVFDFTRQGGGVFVGGNFWDGRATGERLGNPAADQAQGPFLNPVEQGLRDEACVVYRVSTSNYGALYRQVFGDDIDDIEFPSDLDTWCDVEGPPIELARETRDQVWREYDNIALAIAMYEESHNLFSSKFDAVRIGMAEFTKEEQRGFALFQGKGQCARCHPSNGQEPAFTDHTYDNLGVPPNPANPVYTGNPDFVDLGLGGFLATQPVWSDLAAEHDGMMRVPTLRNVDKRPYPGAVKAYMHNGVFKSLEKVVHFYNTRDVLPQCDDIASPEFGVNCWPAPEVEANVNTDELGDLGLSADEEAAIVAFLRTLSDGFMGEHN
ncbi:MAG: cytochrome C, partial [Actinobacteria bacterium]|nr:cytochrome C [Gemmatimonadota bacterium]NIU22289.1 cytochrome C [Actinomycetota bacterium]NIV58856.1 cytochrome C [Actinomycetota bacterium]NIW36912.1 cytochrome C [Gemmatimonadota bacterium]NIX48097.1 cytochrome C [Gemmatimonadota bacterium]